MFGSVMDVVDRFLPDREKHAQVRSMLSFLAVNSTFRGPYSPGSALCLAFALASPGDATMSKVRGGIGAMSDHLLGLFESTVASSAGTSRSPGSSPRRDGSTGRRLGDGEVVTAPVVVSNLDPTATFTQLLDRHELPEAFRRRSTPSTTGRPTSRSTSPSAGSLSTPLPTTCSTNGRAPPNVTFFGTAEQMQA